MALEPGVHLLLALGALVLGRAGYVAVEEITEVLGWSFLRHGRQRLRNQAVSAKASTMSPTATAPVTTVINTGSRRPATNMLKAEVGMRAGSDGSRVKSCRPVRYQRRVGARLSISGATGEPF